MQGLRLGSIICNGVVRFLHGGRCTSGGLASDVVRISQCFVDRSEHLLSFFFLLVWPPRFQSLLIMGWCSYIPDHML